MAFCPNCGTQSPGAFCPNCGTAVAGSASTASSSMGSAPKYQQAQPLSAPGLSDNVAGALCYLGLIVTGIIFLVLAPYNQNKLVRFHAFQAIFLNLAWIVLSVLGVVIHLFGLFHLLLWLAVVVLWLYMMFSTFNNNKVKLPLIGDLAEKQA